MDNTPLVTIGMPVRNEERYLRETIESLLNQELSDFALLISDNASTDGTEEICRAMAARDARIEYRRRDRDVGAIENFKSVAHGCRSRYFIWASGHDLARPDFLSRCVDALEQEPAAVLAFPRAVLIDAGGTHLGVMPSGPDTRGRGMLGRFWVSLIRMPNGNPIYGVIRASALAQTALTRRTISGDIILLSELSMLGSFVLIDDALWCRRENRPPESAFDLVRRQSATLFGKQQPGGVLGAYLHLIGTHATAVMPGIRQPLLSLVLMGMVLIRYCVVVPWRWLFKKQGAVRTVSGAEPAAAEPPSAPDDRGRNQRVE